MQKKLKAKEEQKNSYQHLVQARKEARESNLTSKKSITVFESHSFEISKLPPMLIATGKSRNCKYEIIKHKEKSIFGTQFHPEMSIDGNNLIENFCSL